MDKKIPLLICAVLFMNYTMMYFMINGFSVFRLFFVSNESNLSGIRKSNLSLSKEIPRKTESPIVKENKAILKLVQQYFNKTIPAKYIQQQLELLGVFKRQMEKYNVTYIAYAGTLTGVWRHHGFIPWDDDIDLAVHYGDKDRFLKALFEVNDTYGMHYHQTHWKFFSKSFEKTKYPWTYPFMDIFYLEPVKGGKSMKVNHDKATFPMNDIFPIVKRFFNGTWISTPCNVIAINKVLYDMNNCQSRCFDHRTVGYIPCSSTKCVDLKPYFPFVERSMIKQNDTYLVVEKLVKNKIVIQEVSYNIPLKCG